MFADKLRGPDAVHGSMRFHRIWQPGYRPDMPHVTRVPDLSQGHILLPGAWDNEEEFGPNLVLYEWAALAGNALRGNPDGKPYHIAGMYVEFENNGGAVVSPPSPARDEAGSYYSAISGNRDYLRVPMTATTLESTDPTNFPKGNLTTFFARTQGTTGVKGLTFSAAQQSRVYGAALVAFPDFSDDTQDLIFSRYYPASGSQIIKTASSEIGVEWRLDLQ